MTTQIVLSFLAYTFITAFTPGPNNILALTATSNHGWKKSLRVLMGIYTGFFCVMVLCALFCYGLSALLPKIIPIMKYVGAAYILWLAWHIAVSKPAAVDENSKPPTFLTGMALQFVNVKIILYGITALSGFVMPYYESPWVLLLFAVILSAIGAAGNTAWALAGAAFQKAFRKYYRVLNIVMALLLLECVVSLFLM